MKVTTKKLRRKPKTFKQKYGLTREELRKILKSDKKIHPGKAVQITTMVEVR